MEIVKSFIARLSSRKFLSFLGVIALVLSELNKVGLVVEDRIVLLGMAAISAMVYITTEGAIDMTSKGKDSIVFENIKEQLKPLIKELMTEEQPAIVATPFNTPLDTVTINNKGDIPPYEDRTTLA